MFDWFQRWRFKRAYRRWQKNQTSETLLQTAWTIPQFLYDRYQPSDGLKHRIMTQHQTINTFVDGMQRCIDIVQNTAYVTTKKQTTHYQWLDSYLCDSKGYSLPLHTIQTIVIPTYQQLITAINEQPTDRKRYYERQFQYITEEFSVLMTTIQKILLS